MAEDFQSPQEAGSQEPSRKDFIILASGAAAAIAAAGGAVPFIRSMQPSLDVEAERFAEIDISEVPEGKVTTFEWQGKPVWVFHRNAEQIALAANPPKPSKDPKSKPDSERALKPEYLIVVGICTHLGCIPLYEGGAKEEWKAWHCPCHGSQYDMSARIIAGPAPQDLEVPPLEYLSDTTVLIGEA